MLRQRYRCLQLKTEAILLLSTCATIQRQCSAPHCLPHGGLQPEIWDKGSHSATEPCTTGQKKHSSSASHRLHHRRRLDSTDKLVKVPQELILAFCLCVKLFFGRYSFTHHAPIPCGFLCLSFSFVVNHREQWCKSP